MAKINKTNKGKQQQKQRQRPAQFAEFQQQAKSIHALVSEVAGRRRDPFEYNYMGVLKSTDPLVREKGAHAQDLYDDLMRDGKVFSCIEKRVTTLISKPWQINPIEESELGKTHAKIITQMLKGCRFDQATRGLMDATMIGMSASEIMWDVKDSLITPAKIIKRAARRFRFVEGASHGNTYGNTELRLLTRKNMLQGEPLPDQKFIVHRHGLFDDNPYGQGLGLQLYWPVFFKRCSVVAWNKLNDRFGTPTPWGKYHSQATPEQKQTLLDALAALSSDGVVITPDNATIELLEAAMSGNVISHEALCRYMDNWIASVIIGENSQESSGGALAASSKERRDILLDIAQSDADLLSDTLNETLIKWICDFNGFLPCQISRSIQEEDQKYTADTFKVVYDMGFKPSLEMVREKFGQGWEERDMTQQTQALGYGGFYGAPSFAEQQKPTAQSQDPIDLIDKNVADMSNDEIDQLMQSIIEPVLDSLDKAASFDDMFAAVQQALPKMDTNKLASAISNRLFGAQVLGQELKKE